MEFVFWQNIVSMHQKSFLEALAKQPGAERVTLVVEHELTPVRKEMGWHSQRPEGVEVILSPSDNEVVQVIANNKDAVHVMGGIRIGRMITKAFDECVRLGCKKGVMTEPYDNAGLKGLLREVKYRYYAFKYFRRIDFALTIGKQGVRQYEALGYDTKRLFPWAYFITLPSAISLSPPSDGIIRAIYAGRIEEAKGIYNFTAKLAVTGRKDYRLDIYGTGSEEEKLKTLIKEKGLSEQVTITRFIKYDELLEKYPHCDWVVLPSTGKDGWGVIISEGLLNGAKAICSDICGVSWVIRDGFNGHVFKWVEEGSCDAAIGKMLAEGKTKDKKAIAEWAGKAISGEAGARYFMQITDSVYNKKEKPVVPWLAV